MSSGLKGPRQEYRGYEQCTCRHCRPKATEWWKRLSHKRARRKALKEIKEQYDD